MEIIAMHNNLINKYIRKVTKDMGSNQRKEVAKELEAHILDSADALAAEQNVEVDDAIIRKVILRMGSAEEVAALYPSEKTLSDNLILILKVIARFTFIFIVVFAIAWQILKIYIKELQWDTNTILIMFTIYLVLLAIHLISRFKIISKLLNK